MPDANGRIKTDIRLPTAFSDHVEEVCNVLGVPKNAFYSMAAGFLLITLAPLLSKKVKRRTLLTSVFKIFQKSFDDAIKSA